MIRTITILAFAGGLTLSSLATTQNATPEPAANAQAFVQLLCENLMSKDARVRYSMSRALRTMGAQAVPGLNQMRNQTKNKHEKAFVERILASIKATAAMEKNRNSRASSRNAMTRMMGMNRNLDADRLAAEIDLSLEQISVVVPTLKSLEKDLEDLMAAFREERAWRDKEARDLFSEEQKMAVQRAKDQLTGKVSATQLKRLEKEMNRYANPWGNRNRRASGRRN